MMNLLMHKVTKEDEMLRRLGLLVGWYEGEARMPSWGTRLEARLKARCTLCGKSRHTTQEHVRIPQDALSKRDEA